MIFRNQTGLPLWPSFVRGFGWQSRIAWRGQRNPPGFDRPALLGAQGTQHTLQIAQDPRGCWLACSNGFFQFRAKRWPKKLFTTLHMLAARRNDSSLLTAGKSCNDPICLMDKPLKNRFRTQRLSAVLALSWYLGCVLRSAARVSKRKHRWTSHCRAWG